MGVDGWILTDGFPYVHVLLFIGPGQSGVPFFFDSVRPGSKGRLCVAVDDHWSDCGTMVVWWLLG